MTTMLSIFVTVFSAITPNSDNVDTFFDQCSMENLSELRSLQPAKNAQDWQDVTSTVPLGHLHGFAADEHRVFENADGGRLILAIGELDNFILDGRGPDRMPLPRSGDKAVWCGFRTAIDSEAPPLQEERERLLSLYRPFLAIDDEETVTGRWLMSWRAVSRDDISFSVVTSSDDEENGVRRFDARYALTVD